MTTFKTSRFCLTSLCLIAASAAVPALGQIEFRDPLEDASGANLFVSSPGDTSTGTLANDGNAEVRFGFNYSTGLVGSGLAAGIPEAPNTQPGDAPRTGLYLAANTSVGALNEISAMPRDNGTSSGLLELSGNYEVQADIWMNWQPGVSNSTEFGGLFVGQDPSQPARRSGGGFAFTGDNGAANDYRLYKAPASGSVTSSLYGEQVVSATYNETTEQLENIDGQYSLGLLEGFLNDPVFGDTPPTTAGDFEFANNDENNFFQVPFFEHDYGFALDPDDSQGGEVTGSQFVDDDGDPSNGGGGGDLGFRWATVRIDVRADEMGTGTRDALGVADIYLQATWQDGSASQIVSPEIHIGKIDNSIDNVDDGGNPPAVIDFDGPVGLVYMDIFSSLNTSGLQFGVFDNLMISQEGPAGLLGDFNGDGTVNFGDLGGLVAALTDPAQYAIDFPGVDRLVACDASGNGTCDFGDLGGLVSVFTGTSSTGAGAGSATPIPEPATWLLLSIVFVLPGRRFRR